MTKRITQQQVLQAEKDVLQIRQAIEGEAELLSADYCPRLIAYCALTTSMKFAEKAGLGPVQYAKLVGDTLSLFSRVEGGDTIAVRFVGLSDGTDE